MVDRIDPMADIIHARLQARQHQDPYAEVCFLATVTAQGRPETRAVALRDIDARGFALVLSATSPKWRQLSGVGQCSLLLLWLTVQRQYRVYGHIAPMAEAQLQQYWARKNHPSRLIEHYYDAHHAQSQPIPSHASLHAGIAALTQRYPQAEGIPRPASLRGVYFVPAEIDAWQGSPEDRLHDRQLFTRTDGVWSCQTLVP